MIALTTDTGAGALLACLAFAVLIVGTGMACAVVVDGWRTKNADRRNGLRALARIHEQKELG